MFEKNITIMKKLFYTVLTLLSFNGIAQTTFNYTGNIVTYTVPAGVTNISVEAFGAQGGNTNGGLGAQIYGEFTVTPGQVLNILVGQQGIVNNCGGTNASGGGGGASYIWDPTNTSLPLIAAAGGGGGNTNWGGSNVDGIDGQATQVGTGGANGATLAGTIGEGGLGNGPSGAGAGGAGWNSAGENSTFINGGLGGESLPNFIGGAGAFDFGPGGEGGFGGGGGATCGCGGGAGYSGGSGGEGSATRAGGGGGGSYNGGTNPNNQAGIRNGNGEITISPVLVLVSSISVQGQGGVSTIIIDNGTLQMEAFITPVNATDASVTWSVVNGTGSATIDAAGLLTATHNGTVTVTATANDASGLSDFAVITISNQTAVGINNFGSTDLVNVYPNPTAGNIIIKTNEIIDQIEIVNISGKTVVIINPANQIDISNLENGIYFIKISFNNKQVLTKRIVKI